jgi:hypothetical protein
VAIEKLFNEKSAITVPFSPNDVSKVPPFLDVIDHGPIFNEFQDLF